MDELRRELEPVRQRRLGLDRGWLVAIGIVGLVGIGLLKPWSPPSRPPSSPFPAAVERQPAASPTPAPEPAATETPPPTHEAGLLSSRDGLRLSELRLRAAPLLRGQHVFSAVLATARDTVRVDFTAAAPATPSLGPSCVGGGLLSEDSQRIGVITDGVPLTGVAVDRLFNSGQPVPIPAVTIDRAADAMILSPADGAAWPIGDYALTIRADGQARVVPFCVGRLIRLVDYSLIAFVPRGVDGVSARRLLVAGAGND